MTSPAAALDALTPLLRDVSRSFYLSIRLLPGPLRAPVGISYLLARATDTIADTANAPAAERLGWLDSVGRAIQSGGGAPRLPERALAQPHAGERVLLQRLPECLRALQLLGTADQQDVRTVLGHIVHGQSLDLQRFGDVEGVAALPDAAALHAYTYLVAGCVGEFWTDLSFRHVARVAERPADEMRALGRSFGCALQLVNIVRDAGADVRAGRCYFPADALAAAGLAPAEVLSAPERFLLVWSHWQAAAERGLADGLAYAQATRPRRLRASVAIPAILGRRTLARARAAGAGALAAPAKVPRGEVRALLLRLALGLASREAVQAQWDNRGR